MTEKSLPLALANIDKAKGFHHLPGLVTKANSDDADTPATSTSDDPNKDTHAGNPDNTKPQTGEEETYKKRYSDLKSHYDSEVTKLRQELADTKKQLNSKPLELPKTPEEVAAFRAKFPETADNLISLMRMDRMEERKEWEAEKEALRLEREQLKAERDAEKLLSRHPDAKKISESQDFVDWFNSQPRGIQSLIQSTDVNDTIKGFDLYKQEKGIKNDAATRVKTGSKSTPEHEKKVWYESEIQSLTDRQWDRYEAEIMQAKKEGRVLRG